MQLSIEQEYLLKEYDSATQLTYHIDELRNRLTSFFIAFGGLGAGALTAGGSAVAQDDTAFPATVVVVLLVLLAIIGSVIVLILARLRSVQLEHFRIINNIRTHFIGKSVELRNVVELSDTTLPNPRSRRSGTYYWLLMLLVLVAYSIGTATHLALFLIYAVASLSSSLAVSIATSLVVAWVLDRTYFAIATPGPRREYA